MANSPNDLELIVPTTTDSLAILEIAKGTQLFDAGDVETIQELWSQFIAGDNNDNCYYFLAARQNNEIVGFACYGKRPLTLGTFDLYWLAVESSHQRQGIGDFLLKHVETRVKENDGHLLIAETMGNPSYEPTRRFYFASGYELEARLRDFYSIGDDLFIFTRHFPS